MKSIIHVIVEGNIWAAIYAARGPQDVSIGPRVDVQLRRLVLRRCGGHCEVCGLDCKPIIHLHHIMPAEIGGEGRARNIIGLCPNCHAIIHRFRENSLGIVTWKAWKNGTYSADQQELIRAIAGERLAIEWDGTGVIYEPVSE